ncbi:MAG TPA: CoA ester lyase [Steroidobacteraceae bacterium]|nr:CoA ester lyase [Steroidobacteraceae bacterium]
MTELTPPPGVRRVGTSPPLRSLLFVPGDSERKQTKALASAADLLILDLEDSVASAHLPAAREQVRELLLGNTERSAQQLWVRLNALSSGLLLQDLAAVFPGQPDGIVLPKASSAEEVSEVSHYLSAMEAQAGRPIGSTRLIVIVTETPQALLRLGEYPRASGLTASARERLAGLTWGCEDLSAALGITHKTDRQGSLTFTFQLARSMCVLAAAAVGVQAIDGVFLDYRDLEGLKRDIESARRDGFTGKLAIHPDQIEAINAAFLPAASEIEWARRVVAAFASDPEAGVLSVAGQMVDRPHLVQARRILELVARPRGTP